MSVTAAGGWAVSLQKPLQIVSCVAMCNVSILGTCRYLEQFSIQH